LPSGYLSRSQCAAVLDRRAAKAPQPFAKQATPQPFGGKDQKQDRVKQADEAWLK
jgi:hypothetical protein